MDSDSILLITFMIQNCFRERRGTSEAEFKDELGLRKAWRGRLAASDLTVKRPL